MESDRYNEDLTMTVSDLLLGLLEELFLTVLLLFTVPLEFCLVSKLLSRVLVFRDFFLTDSGEFLLFFA